MILITHTVHASVMSIPISRSRGKIRNTPLSLEAITVISILTEPGLSYGGKENTHKPSHCHPAGPVPGRTQTGMNHKQSDDLTKLSNLWCVTLQEKTIININNYMSLISEG